MPMPTIPKLVYCSHCGKKNRIRHPHLNRVWGCGSCKETIFDNTNPKPSRRKGWDKFLKKTISELSDAKSKMRQAQKSRFNGNEIEKILSTVSSIKSRFEGLKSHLDYIADEHERETIGNEYHTEFVFIQEMISDIEHSHEGGLSFWSRFRRINANTAAIVGSLSSVTILIGAVLSTVGIPNPLMAIGYQMQGQNVLLLDKAIDV